MKRTLLMLIIAVASNGVAQTRNNLDALYAKFISASETNKAAAEFVEVARADPVARTFLSSKLPSLIDQLPSNGSSKVWLNAVRLAGQLKLAAAIPALKRALSKPPTYGAYDDPGYNGASTSTIAERLAFDIVGRALADIGDPSVPALAEILSTGDIAARKRATLILMNIDSPAAEKTMRDHLPRESDPGLKVITKQILHIS